MQGWTYNELFDVCDENNMRVLLRRVRQGCGMKLMVTDDNDRLLYESVVEPGENYDRVADRAFRRLHRQRHL